LNITITKVSLAELGDMRKKFLDIIDNQFTYDKCHLFGWADTWLFKIDDIVAGYGAVWGKDKREDRDSIFEFYLEPNFRKDAHEIFNQFIGTSKASWIECQSNDPGLSEMFFEFAIDIYAEAILFEEDFQSTFPSDGVKLEAVDTSESSKWNVEYVLKHHDEIVGKGGLMLNYNFPYADIYYGVEEQHRRKGYGSLFVQELKKEAYRIGRVPAARTNINNTISKRTMMKAGLKPCGWRLGGKIHTKM
jgi:RimJ/RimL family protein N-acetyltransferase